MIFNSFVFAAFFAVVYMLYSILPHRWQNRMLLVASYIFYGWWDWRFLSLILISTIVDYWCGLRIDGATSDRKRKIFLAASVCTNLGILGFFKYANFFAESLNDGLLAFGIETDIRLMSIVLPVGISFYTFQTMSYTIDIYRRELSPTRHFFDFALFVAYFPQLVAGPIERARILLPQISHPRTIRKDQIEEGCWLILSGYYLKCVLADNLAPFVDDVFQSPESAVGLQVLVGLWAAAFQIYGDFAGYSRIAIGISKLMGIDLMQNFNRPYLATSPSGFWRRWHVSLSTWLRDYLYITLGGSRGSTWQTYRNLMLTMVLGGLWHGAAWNFILWGAFHGGILCLWRMFATQSNPPDKRGNELLTVFQKLAGAILFFQLTCVGWLLFYVENISDIGLLVTNCLQNWSLNGRVGLLSIIVFATPVIVFEVIGDLRNTKHIVFRFPMFARLFVYAIVAFMIVCCGSLEPREFIYFQF